MICWRRNLLQIIQTDAVNLFTSQTIFKVIKCWLINIQSFSFLLFAGNKLLS